MTYWKTTDADCITVKGLINGEDGKCAAWANLFRDILKVQGVSGVERADIHPDPSAIDPNNQLQRVGFGVINTLPAQGGNPAQFNFEDHAIVVYENALYDPSYGSNIVPAKGNAPNLIAYQIQSLDHVRFEYKGNKQPFLIKNTNKAFQQYPLISIVKTFP